MMKRTGMPEEGTKEKEQKIKKRWEGARVCISQHVSLGAWPRQGWGPLGGQIGGVADVPKGKRGKSSRCPALLGD